MWQPIGLEINNFLSFTKADIKFKQADNDAVVIALCGENRTAEGADSNGSGKSSIIDAIMFAITGTTTRGITNSELVKIGSDTAMVRILLYNSTSQGILSIERVIRIGKSATVAIQLNRVTVNTVDTNEANAWILERLGIEKSDLINYFLVNNNSTDTFFKLGDASKKRLISRFINLDTLSAYTASVNKRLAILNKSTAQLQNHSIPALERQISNLQQQVEMSKLKIENEKQIKLQKAQLDIDAAKGLYQSCLDTIVDYDRQISSLTDKKATASIAKLNKELDKHRADLVDLDKWIFDNSTELEAEKRNVRSLTGLLNSGGVPCTDCGGKNYIFNTTSYTREDIDRLKELAVKNMSYHTDKIVEYSQKKRDIIADMTTITTKISDYQGDLSAIEILENNKKRIVDKSEKLSGEIKDLELSYEVMLKSPVESSQQELNLAEANTEILNHQCKLDDLNKELSESMTELGHLQYWSVNLGKEGFEAFITNKCLLYIQNAINKFLMMFNRDLSIVVEGESMTKSEEVRNKINVSVIQNGIKTSYSALSHGEQIRLDVCGVLAVQQLINASAANRIADGGLNLLVLDELFEGLDSKGQSNIVNLLRTVNQLVIFVTHLQGESGMATRWTVVKEESGSRLYTNAV